MAEESRVGIVGAGAIGGLVAGLLAREGFDVTLVGRPDAVAVIEGRGLSIDGLRGEFTVHPRVSDHASSIEGVDLVLLAVKMQDAETALSALAPYLGESATLVTLQNGVRGPKMAANAVGPDRVVGAVVALGVTYLQPGHVSFTTDGFLALGAASGPVNDRVVRAAEVLSRTFTVETTDDLAGALWAKLIVNTDLPILALTGKEYPAGLLDVDIHWLALQTAEEGLAIVERAGVHLPGGRTEAMLRGKLALLRSNPEQVRERVAGIASSLVPSSLQSVLRGRRHEINYINGEVARLAEESGKRAPFNASLTYLAQRLEAVGFSFLTANQVRSLVVEKATLTGRALGVKQSELNTRRS
jgi:2-dehydropantoate 2-reductase